MGWIIALVLVVLVAFIPLGIKVDYNAEGVCVFWIAGPIRIPVKTGKAKSKDKSSKLTSDNLKGAEKPKNGSYMDFLPLLRLVLDFLGELRTKIRIKELRMKLTLAGGDPCDLAVNYGRAWAALGNLMPHLERAFTIKKRNLEVACDFLTEDISIEASADIRISLTRVIQLAAKHGFRIIKEYMNVMNKRKGGAKT